jgi:hypothetical protein
VRDHDGECDDNPHAAKPPKGAARSAARSEAGGSGCACGASNHLVSALSSLTCRTWLGLANMAGVITSDHLVSALGSLTWWWGG